MTYKTNGNGNLLEVIHQIYGLSVVKNMLNLKAGNDVKKSYVLYIVIAIAIIALILILFEKPNKNKKQKSKRKKSAVNSDDQS